MTKTWLVCIDDTDEIGTKGTGEIAEEIMQLIVSQSSVRPQDNPALGNAIGVTRHQLYVHPDIPYTSHNSAMCFELKSDLSLLQLKDICIAHLLAESALAADPGLAIVDKATLSPVECQQLMAFGLDAKKQVKTKSDAYQMASAVGIDLSEHGGTGQGVIGAVAGIGLRLSGNDGRLKGQLSMGLSAQTPSLNLSVKQIKILSGLDAVMAVNAQVLDDQDVIHLSGKVKAVLSNHQFVLLVYQYSEPATGTFQWRNALKQHLKDY